MDDRPRPASAQLVRVWDSLLTSSSPHPYLVITSSLPRHRLILPHPHPHLVLTSSNFHRSLTGQTLIPRTYSVVDDWPIRRSKHHALYKAEQAVEYRCKIGRHQSVHVHGLERGLHLA